ncbi:conserved hypothetical protein [Leishmania major strain Friedlin]|uniref:Uncharacterized protein n=1 Tax=Leishmania major TaxID=5664 RepID=Q4Q5F0_LEIMA|nr:conserved hypothetical protein [Leishmania major strain Friedlin]CAG9580195.1 hypothetical_protein_-_conserved [Leishmania major strain Friedlin]CAJ08652.1 conserved hypothetical protein [Leishmania major strain Friedlin]|eukprot:XP_001685448.1 conserved hypothetical protein [Leishmania major strain Friedlin]
MNRDGVEDGIYVNFFGFDGKAAMLACDMYGILPENLLYLPKKMFLQTGDESEQVLLVRYTMCERSRQGTFRTLLGAKSKLIAEGKVEALWEERRRVCQGAAPCPRFTEKQLEEAAAALDTDSESDEERQVDERGMRKPPPPLPPAPPFAPDGPRGEAAAEAAATENDESPTPVTDTPFSRAPDSEPLPPPPTQASSDAGGETRRGSGTTATNDNAALAVDAKRTTQQLPNDWTQYDVVNSLELPRAHKLCSQPPSIPQAYFPRLLETLSMEEKELAAAQKELSRYSKKSARRLRARQQERSNEPSAPGRSTSLPPLSSSPAHKPATTHLHQSVELRNRRELAAVHRVAQAHLRFLSERYEQGRSIDEKMEGVATLGTLEHMLKYQKSIGVAPEFEDRLQSKMVREESRAALQQQLRESEWERAYAIEEKAQHAQEVLERERERTKGIVAEALRTQRLITDWKQVAAHRQQETHLNGVLHRSAVRHAKADAYIETKRAATGMSRYYHDQQEVHRRQLRDTIRDMMISKKFSADGVADEDNDVVA